MHRLRHFITERARTARRYLSATGFPVPINELKIVEIDKKNNSAQAEALSWLQDGHDVGLISESGMPGIADPGMAIVRMAHDHNIKVKPLSGPSSIPLALAASGLNGQNFSFEGYLPIKDHALKSALSRLESDVLKKNQTKIFIETPYRNDRMLRFLLDNLNNKIRLCVAIDITGQKELIRTKPIAEWKTSRGFTIGKLPALFLLGK